MWWLRESWCCHLWSAPFQKLLLDIIIFSSAKLLINSVSNRKSSYHNWCIAFFKYLTYKTSKSKENDKFWFNGRNDSSISLQITCKIKSWILQNLNLTFLERLMHFYFLISFIHVRKSFHLKVIPIFHGQKLRLV